mgnify:CR=1
MEIDKIAAEIGISADTLRSLYRNFLESTLKHLEDLEEGIRNVDPKDVKTTAHHIKGAAINLDLAGLAEKAKIIEDTAEQNNWEETKRLFSELKAQFQQEKETVLKLLQ